ncbi:MAG: hypothetical protein C0403_01015 [Desulfobacterium sp.]|nr:hypothetical protein [Desulfobacterium sp.]
MSRLNFDPLIIPKVTALLAMCVLIGCVSTVPKTSQQVSEPPTSSAQSSMSAEQRQAKINADISFIVNALVVYRKDHGAYPTDQQGLQILLTASASGPPYANALPKTPWGRDYLYKTTDVLLICSARSQPMGIGWKWREGNQQWERTDNGYIVQVLTPEGTYNSMPKNQFGDLPPDVYIAPASGIK